MNYKAIIFDMDGTIVDTEHIWKLASHTLITKRGITITPELEQILNKQLAGCSTPESCKFIKELVNLEDELSDLIQEKSHHAYSMYEQGINFIEGFQDFHKKIIGYQLKTGLATNADDHTLQITKRSLKLEEYFGQHMYNLSHVNNLPKPNPALYLHAAKQLALDPAQCIAIEDSAHGLKAAKDAGMLCIGITTQKKPGLLDTADIIIDRYDEIKIEELLGITK